MDSVASGWRRMRQYNKTIRALIGEIKGIDPDRCQRCKRHISLCPRKSLHVHHKDGNPNNNSSKNLMILCSACHTKTHKGKRQKKELRKCLYCGKDFQGYHNYSFCSADCAHKHTTKQLDDAIERREMIDNIKRRKDAGIEGKRRCFYCGGTIYPNHKHYCILKKKKHSDLGKKEIIIKKDDEGKEKTCAFCHKGFIGKGIVCSNGCGEKLILENIKK